MIVQRRNYEEYGLEVLRADYMHALVDLVAAFAATVGVVLVYHTGSEKLELFFALVSSMFIVHSLLEILRDVVRTITGGNVDYELSARLLKRLVNEQKGFRVEDVVARRIGSFYIVEVKVRVDPRERLETLHRLRGRIARSVLEESSMIYHVDVRFYPDRARRRR
jgi:divalent metal cation (Fe/Co/Zn/Cd) transporter